MPGRIAIVLNAGSGGHAPLDPEALRRPFAASGLAADVFQCAPGGSLGDALRAALDTHPDALVAAGGDGTVNAVAAAALAHDLPLGVLPAGTLNHFARDLDLPADLDAAAGVVAAALAAGRERRGDVATANRQRFRNNASQGL
ncbi:MAG: diacylglycerol/lipid kinase family protein [Luteimonas sp.]